MTDDRDRDEVMAAVGESELAMADAIAQDFLAVDGEGEFTVIDYVAVGKYLDEDGDVAFRMTTRSDTQLVEAIGMLEFALMSVREKMHRRMTGRTE